MASFGSLDGEGGPNYLDLENPKIQNNCINTSGLTPLNKLRVSRDENIILVLGSEGEGVSRFIAQAADTKVVIPPQLRMD